MTVIDKKLRKAQKLHQAGRLSEAASLYQKLLKKQPDAAVLLFPLGLMLLGQGRCNDAIAYFQKILSSQINQPNQPNQPNQIGQPDNLYLDSLYYLAACYQALNQTGKACDLLLQLIKLDPGALKAYSALAELALKAGDVAVAANAYEQLNTQQPNAQHALQLGCVDAPEPS